MKMTTCAQSFIATRRTSTSRSDVTAPSIDQGPKTTSVAYEPKRISHGVAVGQNDENQHAEHHHDDAEGGLLPVPGLRLPHGKIFASDHQEAEEPEAKAARQAGHGQNLGAVEALGRRLKPRQQCQRAD